jgi:uncharacterized membrane protein SirB2
MSRLLATIFLKGTLISFIVGIILIAIVLYPETSHFDNGYFIYYALACFCFGSIIWIVKHTQ